MSILPKIKVYVQLFDQGCHIFENPKGDMFDLRAAQTVDIKAPQTGERYKSNGEYYRDTTIANAMVPLGVRIKLPAGYRANVLPRSGTYKNYHVAFANSMGIIDNCYNGPKDQWMANLVAMGTCHIEGPRVAEEADYLNEKLTIVNGYVQGDRIAQFEIVLSQKATFWQKVKWLFHSGVEIIYVDDIDSDTNRDGFGSSGVK